MLLRRSRNYQVHVYTIIVVKPKTPFVPFTRYVRTHTCLHFREKSLVQNLAVCLPVSGMQLRNVVNHRWVLIHLQMQSVHDTSIWIWSLNAGVHGLTHFNYHERRVGYICRPQSVLAYHSIRIRQTSRVSICYSAWRTIGRPTCYHIDGLANS